MVKIRGPLYSEGASGTIADALVTSTWKGRSYIRSRVIPTNPRTTAQTATRAPIQFISQACARLTPQEKATWQDLAAQNNVAPYNAFVKKNLTDLNQGNPPTTTDPAPQTSTPPTQPTVTPSTTPTQITLTIAAGATPPEWGYAIYRSNE